MSRRRSDAGLATAEMAVALPALVAVVLVCVGLVGAASSALRCEDAARLAARSLARGDPPAAALALAGKEAPPGAAVADTAPGGGQPALVRVRVAARVRLPGPLGGVLPTWTVSGTATALDESGP